MSIYKVELSNSVEKILKRNILPDYILIKLYAWISSIEKVGLAEVRKLKGYNDEALKGLRKGQRSIRLNKAYRAIYIIKKDKVSFVLVEEVHKHKY